MPNLFRNRCVNRGHFPCSVMPLGNVSLTTVIRGKGTSAFSRRWGALSWTKASVVPKQVVLHHGVIKFQNVLGSAGFNSLGNQTGSLGEAPECTTTEGWMSGSCPSAPEVGLWRVWFACPAPPWTTGSWAGAGPFSGSCTAPNHLQQQQLLAQRMQGPSLTPATLAETQGTIVIAGQFF